MSTIGTPVPLFPSREENLDITYPAPGNGEVLTFNSASSKWKNQAVSGGGGSGATVGSRASLPSTPSSSGSIYLCTDSDYEYFSDGSAWRTRVFGYQGIDPATDSTIVKKNTTTITGSSSDTSKGGINFTVGTASGDQIEGWLKPITQTGTLTVAIGFNQANGTTPQAGIAAYNSANGKWTIFRFAAGQLYASQYLDGMGFVSNTSPISWINPWPRRGVWGVTFSGATVKINFYSDSDLWVPTNDINSGSGYSDTYAGGYTHIGVAANLSAVGAWFQFIKIVRT